MGSQDTHHDEPSALRQFTPRSDTDHWLSEFRKLMNNIPERSFVTGSLHDVNRLKAASATLASMLELIYEERKTQRKLADIS